MFSTVARVDEGLESAEGEQFVAVRLAFCGVVVGHLASSVSG
jgi:hypothetical protein